MIFPDDYLLQREATFREPPFFWWACPLHPPFAAILDSQNEMAKEAKRWIAREVIPVVRHPRSRALPDLTSLGMRGP
jgi:hypothetical protein